MLKNEMRVVGLGIVCIIGGLAACAEPTRRPPPQQMSTGAAGVFGSSVAGVFGSSTGAAGTFVPVGNPSGAAGGPVACGADGKPTVAPPAGRMGSPVMLPPDVTRSAKTPPAIIGGTLLTLADGKTVVVADPDRDRVYIVDLDVSAVRSTVVLEAGDEPGRVIEDGAKRVHVSLRRGGALLTIDPATGAIGARRAVCAAPRGVAYQAAGDLVHVACAGGELVSLPAAGGAATRTLTLDRDLRDVVVGAGGALMVSTFRRAEVLVVGTDGKVGQRLQPGKGLVPSFFGPPRNMSPSVAWRMLPMNDAEGSVIMLHQTGVDDEINPAAGGYAGLKGCSAIVEAGVSVLSPAASTAPPVARGFEMVSLAVDIAVSPDRSQMALAVPSNAATTFPTLVAGPIQGASMVNGSTPPSGTPGCTFLGNTTATTAPKGEVVAVSYATNTLLLAQMREPAILWRADTGGQIVLSTESRADTGHMIFHLNAGGGLACASCHPEGGEDGRVWKFACQGSRRTQSIRGAIGGTAPFHWDGAETSFSALMDDVFSQRMVGPVLSAQQKDALAGWVETIPALPAATGLDAAAVARGKMLFNDTKVACGTCHLGALLTNNATVDVGTGRPMQVPSLRGVSWRAPFMHDGCAATLADRFGSATCGGGDKHGVTSELAPAALADLTTYLQSL